MKKFILKLYLSGFDFNWNRFTVKSGNDKKIYVCHDTRDKKIVELGEGDELFQSWNIDTVVRSEGWMHLRVENGVLRCIDFRSNYYYEGESEEVKYKEGYYWYSEDYEYFDEYEGYIEETDETKLFGDEARKAIEEIHFERSEDVFAPLRSIEVIKINS